MLIWPGNQFGQDELNSIFTKKYCIKIIFAKASQNILMLSLMWKKNVQYISWYLENYCDKYWEQPFLIRLTDWSVWLNKGLHTENTINITFKHIYFFLMTISRYLGLKSRQKPLQKSSTTPSLHFDDFFNLT